MKIFGAKSNYFFAIIAFIFSVFFAPSVYAIMYAPGATLAPACGPTDANCGVTASVYTSSTLTDGALLFASSSAWTLLPAGTNGQVLKLSGGLPAWGTDAGGTSYTAGSGLSLSSAAFALDLTNANAWSGIQSFNNGFALGGNTFTNLSGTGLSFSSGVLSSSLGTSIDSSEITDGTIATADIANGAVTFGKLSQNSCATNEIIKWNGSGWACSADNSNTYTAGSGLSLTGDAFALDINGLSAVSSVNSADTVAIYTASGLKKITRSDMFSDVLGAMNYRGTWNASSNSPDLSSYCVTGTKGHYYVISTSGTTNLSGITSWAVNDWAVCNGTAWEKVQTTNAVTSVFGRTGAVIASGNDYNALQITNTAGGNIAAITVQNALNELDTEKLATGLNSGLIFVGNASNQATAAALSGDITIDNAGVATIGADKVALGTDTTGNYLATLADSGVGIFTIANSGAENAAATIALANNSLNFTKFADALTLDASTSITLGGNDLTFALTGAGLPKFTRTSSGQWMNFADDTDIFGIYNRAGTPESNIAADKGSLAIDTTNGALYIKTTDTLNTGWSAFGLASAGITSLNGLTGATQTFATSTTGTDFTIISSGTAHTFNIPDASAAARGLITTGTQTIAGAKTFTSAIVAPTATNTINGLIINSGALSGITGIAMTSGNFTQAGAGTLSTGTGAVSINGDTTIAAGKTLTLSAMTTAGILHNDVTTGLITSSLVVNADVSAAAAIALSKLASGTSIATSLTTPTGTNANGGSITNNVLTLSFANGSNPGLVSTSTQTFAGAKTFTTAPTFSTMTAGSVTFAGTAGVVSQDNSNLFWDDTNNRLGIGTAVPKTLLTINRGGTEMAESTYDVLRLISNDHPVMRLYDGDGTVAAIGPDSGTFYIGSSGSWTFKNGTTQTGHLYSTGTNVATISVAGAYAQASDRREKHDITDLTYGLETVLKLKPSSYVYNIDETNATALGFIAQDLLNVVPEVVSSNGEGDAQRYAVNYSGLIPVLVKSIQDLNFKVETGFGTIIDTIKEQQLEINALKTNNSIDIDTLNQLAISGALSVDGHVTFGKDTVGEATMSANATSTTITFDAPYTEKPSIVVTPEGQVNGTYWVTITDGAGFSINVSQAQSADVVFSWHSFAQKGKAFTAKTVAPVVAPTPTPVVIEPVVETPTPTTVLTPTIVEPVVEPTPAPVSEPAPLPTKPVVEPAPVVIEPVK